MKVYREEREMTLMLVVDVSPSQRFGTHKRFKLEIAAELAAVLAFLATKNNDKVGLLVFSDHVEHYIPPKKGRAHVWRIIRSVLTHRSQGRRTDIAGCLSHLMRVLSKKSLCFLISDFQAKNFHRNLSLVRRKHDTTCVVVRDPAEVELPRCGMIEVEDSESGQIFTVDSQNPRIREAYSQAVSKENEDLLGFFKKNKIDYFHLDTRESVVGPLITFFKKRERRNP